MVFRPQQRDHRHRVPPRYPGAGRAGQPAGIPQQRHRGGCDQQFRHQPPGQCIQWRAQGTGSRAHTYFPTYLPSLLDGLGFQGSLTLLDSSQNVPVFDISGKQIGEQQSSFFGVSDFSYNATLAYDKGPIGARLSYVYRNPWQARYEARLFANPLGVWRRAEASLDFQLTARLTDRWA